MKHIVAIFSALAMLCAPMMPAEADIPTLTATGSLTATGVSTALTLAGQSTCSIVVSGSGTGITLVPQASSDSGSTFVTVATIGAGSISANGTYVGNISNTGLTTFRFNLTALASGTLNYVLTCAPSFGSVATIGSLSNLSSPAQNSSGATVPILCDNWAAINISTATTTEIVAFVAGKKIWVCGYSLYVVSGTTPSFQFVTASAGSAACASGLTAITGTFGGIAGAVGTNFVASGYSPLFRSFVGSALCIVSAGTTPNIQGYVTFAQI